MFYRFLKTDGSILLDVYSLKAFDQRKEASSYEYKQLNGFWAPENYYGFLNTFKYDEEKVVLDKYTIIEEAQTRTVYNWLQYFSPESLRKEFEENGFKIEEYYSDVAGTIFSPKSLEFAIVVKKF